MASKMYKIYRVDIEPYYIKWREKSPNECPARSIKIKLSAESIDDAQKKVWDIINVDKNMYEIASICVDGYGKTLRYSDDED